MALCVSLGNGVAVEICRGEEGQKKSYSIERENKLRIQCTGPLASCDTRCPAPALLEVDVGVWFFFALFCSMVKLGLEYEHGYNCDQHHRHNPLDTRLPSSLAPNNPLF